ncbi:hypothetical protein ACOFKK_07425 [Vagococcus fluvialis]
MTRVEDVFGVNKNISTYLERENVDGKMKSALDEKKHVVVYGSSQQGKTLLLDRLQIEKKIKINIGNNFKVVDIYKAIIRQLEVLLTNKTVSTESSGSTALAGADLSAKVAFFGKASAKIEGGFDSNEMTEIEADHVEYDLSQAQSIVEILIKENITHKILIDDFHYLELEEQKKLAKDLKVFYENEIQFIILGVWKEKNWLLQHNPELADRLELIPVEPWTPENFKEIIRKGSEDLGISFQEEVINDIIQSSLGNVGILQDICKICCVNSKRRNDGIVTSEDFEEAISEKRISYSTHNIAILNKVATYNEKGVLFLPYYLIRVILEVDISRLKEGLTKKYLQYQIQQRHYDKRDEKVRPSEMTKFLNNSLIQMQSNLSIEPLIFDYNLESEIFSIIDSRLIFYIANTEVNKMVESLEIPEELDQILLEEGTDIKVLVQIPDDKKQEYKMYIKALGLQDTDESKIEFIKALEKVR